MRTLLKLAAATGLAATVSCAKDGATASDELTRDLQLAATANIQFANQQAAYALNETVPKTEPQPKRILRRDPGPAAIPSPTPTVAAEPDPEIIAAATSDLPQVVATAAAAAASIVLERVPATPRPVPQTVPTSGPNAAEGQDMGSAGGGMGGGGGGLGGIFGPGTVVIRGGGVGEDRCEIHDRGRLPGRIPGTMPGVPGSTGPRVYNPNPGPTAINTRVPQRSVGTSIARRRP